MREQISAGLHFCAVRQPIDNSDIENKSNISRKEKKVRKKAFKQRQGLEVRRSLPFQCNFNHDNSCCNRNCFENFKNTNIDEYRRIVRTYPVHVHRQRIREYHKENLTINGKSCCVNFLLNCFDISKSWLYPKHNPVPKFPDCPKTISICSWFEYLKKVAI